MEILIRVASEIDVPGIRRAIRSSIEGLAVKDYSEDILQSWGVDNERAREKQRSAIRDGRELTWVAVNGDTIVGFSALSPATAELRAVYVTAEVARKGIGTLLLQEVEAKARSLGLARLHMHSSLTAVPFYERYGYVNLGEQIHTLGSGVQMRSISMAKTLLPAANGPL